jgi:hypothetical protein
VSRDPRNEIDLMRRLQVRASSQGARLWRNQVGSGLMVRGKNREQIIEACQALAEKMGGSAARVTFGLPTGSGDMVGFVPYRVKPEDTGRVLPLFACPEVKFGKGRLSEDQKAWAAFVQQNGGAWAELRDEAGLDEWLAQYR